MRTTQKKKMESFKMIHPNRLTSTLGNSHLIIPSELKWELRRNNIETIPAKIARKKAKRKKGVEFDLSIARHGMVTVPGSYFDEAGYSSGDVVQIEMKNGRMLFSYKEKKIEDQFRAAEVGPHGMMVPPAWLCQAFIGDPNTEGFLTSGKDVAEFFMNLAKTHGANDFTSGGRVVDFGCGCGRIVSWMPQTEGLEYVGVDLHEEAIDWMQLAMPEASFFKGSFDFRLNEHVQGADFLFAVSVLTHLDEEFGHACLKDWRDTLKPGGVAIVTYRDETWIDEFIGKSERGEIRASLEAGDGFFYTTTQYWKGVFPSFYGGTYHSRDYIERVWGDVFELVDVISYTDSPLSEHTAVLRRRP